MALSLIKLPVVVYSVRNSLKLLITSCNHSDCVRSHTANMKISSLISTLALPLATFAAKKPTDRFSTSFSKTLPLKLDDGSFSHLTTAPRDYGIAVLLTALEPRFGCAVCQEFQPEWDVLARSWQKGDKAGASRLLFGTLDFMDGKGTFQSLGLQHAPVLLLFSPTTGPNAKADSSPVRFDFTAGYVYPHPTSTPVSQPASYTLLTQHVEPRAQTLSRPGWPAIYPKVLIPPLSVPSTT